MGHSYTPNLEIIGIWVKRQLYLMRMQPTSVMMPTCVHFSLGTARLLPPEGLPSGVREFEVS